MRPSEPTQPAPGVNAVGLEKSGPKAAHFSEAHSRVLRYGVALGAVAVAAAARLLLIPYIGLKLPFILSFPAVFFAAWLGGLGPGLWATALASALAGYLFLAPVRSLSVESPRDVLGLVLFASFGVAFSWLKETVHRSRRTRLAALEREARSRSGMTKAITDNATLGLVMMDARQYCTFMNPAAERILGYTFDDVRAMDCPLHDVVHHTRPDGTHFPMEECPIDRAFPQRMREQGEDVFVRPDGTFYPVAFTASPIVDGGVAVGTIIEVEDLSERRRAAEELQKTKSWLEASEARLRLVIEHSPQGVALFDREMRYLFASRRWREDYRLGDADLAGRSHYEVFPDLPERWKAVHRRALAGVTERSDGEPFPRAGRCVQWIRWEVRPWHDATGAIGGSIIFSEDITAMKEAATRLQLLSQSSGALIRAKLDRRDLLEQLVEQIVPTLGESASAVLLSDDHERLEVAACRHVDPAAQEQMRATLAEAMLRRGEGAASRVIETGEALLIPEVPGAVPRAIETELTGCLDSRPAGSFLAVPLHTSRVVVGALNATRPPGTPPFTDEDKAMLQEIADRAALVLEAAQRYAEAQEAIRLRDDFLSIASHELRTPLTALQLQLQAMRHLLSKRDGSEQDRFPRKLETAARQTERLGRLVNDLLDVSRISLGELSLKLEPVDLAEVAREVAERHAAEAQAAGCTLILDAARDVTGDWDRLRIEQVLTNLITNAVKYGPGQRIEVKVEAHGASARVSVRDHGMGIGPDDARRIFGRFERAVSSRHYGGLGLGLYISQQIVDAHGGTIDVQSEPGQGSVFTVTVPRRPRPERRIRDERAA